MLCVVGNGTIEFNEFLAMMSRSTKNVDLEQEMKQAFKGLYTATPPVCTCSDVPPLAGLC